MRRLSSAAFPSSTLLLSPLSSILKNGKKNHLKFSYNAEFGTVRARRLVLITASAQLFHYFTTTEKEGKSTSDDTFVQRTDSKGSTGGRMEEAEAEEERNEKLRAIVAEKIFGDLDSAHRKAAAEVDQRKVLFAFGSSSELNPRAAANEAFEFAAAALPRPPNFCIVNFSLDLSTMIDVPEFTWGNLKQANKSAVDLKGDKSSSSSSLASNSSSQRLTMIGTAVNSQRFHRAGFVQVLLGSIPDLVSDIFTLDAVPSVEFMSRTRDGNTGDSNNSGCGNYGENNGLIPPPVCCYVSIDANLAKYHETMINRNLSTLVDIASKSSSSAITMPVFGAVLPLIGIKSKDDNSKLNKGDKNQDRGEDNFEDSIAFFNDKVYKGSAAACVLRSNLIGCDVTSVIPSIELTTGKLTGCFSNENGDGVTITSINGQKATEFVKNVYENHLQNNKTSKVFIGVEYNYRNSDNKETKGIVPLSYYGNTKDGTIVLASIPHFLLPHSNYIYEGVEVHFVCDDADLDMEYLAGSTMKSLESLSNFSPIKNQKNLANENLEIDSKYSLVKSVVKSVALSGNRRKRVDRNILTSSCAGLHFSNRTMNQIAVNNDNVITFGGSSYSASNTPLFLPPVIARCLGSQLATNGFYSPGQIITLASGKYPTIMARSATNVLLYGKE